MTPRKLAAVLLLLLAAIVGCSKTTSGGTISSGLAHGSPLASVPGADKATAEAIVRQCFPVTESGVKQLQWATGIINDRQPHLNGSRLRTWNCVGIPPDKRQPAEGALITAIEGVHWTKPESRKVFWDQTLPGWVQQWRSG